MDQNSHQAQQLEAQHKLAKIYHDILVMDVFIAKFIGTSPLTDEDLALIRHAFGINQQ